jgi:hypothetical protein
MADSHFEPVTKFGDAVYRIGERIYKTSSERERALADYFIRIGSAFRTIARDLRAARRDRSKDLPRVEGNELKELLLQFKEIASPVIKADYATELATQAESAADGAQRVDYHILEMESPYSEIEVERYITEIERTAGRFLGVAGRLLAGGAQPGRGYLFLINWVAVLSALVAGGGIGYAVARFLVK